MRIIATLSSKKKAQTLAKQKNKGSKVFHYTVLKSPFVSGHWNVVKKRKQSYYSVF